MTTPTLPALTRTAMTRLPLRLRRRRRLPLRLPRLERTAPLAAVTALGLLAIVATTSPLRSATPKFFNDDPLWVEPSSQDASKVEPWEIDLVIDLAYNQFGNPGDPTPNVGAQNVNSIDEVPDSAWFTNRAGHRPLTADDVGTGPDTTSGPAPGTWTITSGKTDGITPGFTVKDANGQRWFIKFDPPGYRGMATGTEVTVTKLFWALGYHVPENHLAALRRDQLAIDKDATFTPPGPGRKKRTMKESDVDRLLASADRDADGTYRVVASKALEGKVLGGFRFYDTRPDDPNDLVPHEHRRELRGYGVFSAWLNHVDAKAINSMDTLVSVDGKTIVRHNLLDFGSTLGSGGVAPREAWEGAEYLVEAKDIPKQMASFGFAIPEWRRVPLYTHPAIGTLPRDNTTWRPEAWKPRVPNAAFLRARADDRFWAATKAAAITDDMIRAAVRAGRFGSEEAEQFLARAIIERRDAILRAYLPAVTPIVSPALSAEGTLTFRNAAVDAGVAQSPQGYTAAWGAYDNATGSVRPLMLGGVVGGTPAGTVPGLLEGAREVALQAPPNLPREAGAFVKVEIHASGGAPPAWARPVDVYFHRTPAGWKLVGLERLPGNTAAPVKPAKTAAANTPARRRPAHARDADGYFFESMVKPMPTPPCAAIGCSANFVDPTPTVTVRPATMPSAAPKATSLR